MKRPVFGFLLLSLLISCNTFQLTTGKTTSLTAPGQTDLLTAINTFRNTNTECSQNGIKTKYTPGTLTPYTWNAKLETAALSHANFLEQHNTTISLGDPHNGVGDSSVGVRLQATGYSSNTYGENIGAGQTTTPDLIEAFRTSNNGHCNNLMDNQFTQVGVALVTDSDAAGVKKYDNYWVLDFGKSN
jgi:uncharacterized protein YkwD